MKFKLHIKRFRHGLSLIEVMVSILILLAAVVGATRYQYYTAMDARRADLYGQASRLAVTMLEGWKGAGGKVTFDPLVDFGNGYQPDFKTNMVLDRIGNGSPPAGMDVAIGEYRIIADRATYHITLSYIDVDFPDDLPIALNVLVTWGERGHDDEHDKSLSITCYECNE